MPEEADRPTDKCPVCSKPLGSGASLLFQNDQLVHALCWRATNRPADQAAAKGSEDLREPNNATRADAKGRRPGSA